MNGEELSMSRISELLTVKIPLKIRIVRIVFELAAFLLALIPPFLTLYLTDEMIEKGKKIPFFWIFLVIVLCLFIHLFQFYFSRYKEQVYVNRVAETYRLESAGKISRSQISSYEKESKSKIFNIINDMNPVYTLANYLICVPVDLIEIVTVIFLLFRTHYGLGMIALLMAPLYLISSYLNKGKLEHLVREERKHLDSWQREVDIILNYKVSIGLNRAWSYMLERYRSTLAGFYQTQNQKHFFLLLTQELPKLITTLAPLLILIVGGNLVVGSRMSLGTLLFALQLIGYLFTPLGDIAMVQADLMSQRPNFRRSREFFQMSEQVEEFPGCEEKKIEAENITLRRADQSVLYRIPEFSVHGTGLVLIRGENGCGKSTFFNILSGVFSGGQVESGADGNFQMASVYRKNCTYLFYPGFIFPGTVKENILCGREGLSEEYEAAEQILHLPPAGKQVTTKPENLSLGEKQKIFLARILLSSDPLLLLDEPGSNLDSQTEQRLARELERKKRDRLILVISHNEVYDSIADQIYNIQGGVMRKEK